MTIIAATTQGTDHHSGYYFIPLFQLVVIALNKQMVCFGELKIDGTLFIDGMLILEP